MPLCCSLVAWDTLLRFSRFHDWVDLLDRDLLDAAQTVNSWLATTLFVGMVGALVHVVPGVQVLVGLDLRPALGVFVGAALVGTWNAYRYERGAGLGSVAPVMVLEALLLMVFSLAALSYAEAKVSSFLGFVCLIVATYQGVILQTTWRHPFGLVGILGGIGVSMVLFEQARTPVNLVVLYPIAIFLHVLAGTWAKQAAMHTKQTSQYREALLAQHVLETVSKNEQLEHTLTDMLGLRHDLNNLFQVIEATSTLLGFSELDEDQHELVTDMNQAHQGMRALLKGFTTTKTLLRPLPLPQGEETPEYKVLDLELVLGEFIRRTRRREQHLALKFDSHGPCWASFHGGAQTLDRVLDNLVRNAKEGDGHRGASQVQITLGRSADGGRQILTVEDDGPGFMPGVLDRGFEMFQTTKPQGTGLGLYTVDRIITAHQGALKLGRSKLGGASVAIHLPVHKTPFLPPST